MNPRIPIAVGAGLVMAALGGFYFVLSPRSGEVRTSPAQIALTPTAAVPPPVTVPPSAAISPSAEVASGVIVPPVPPEPAPPPMATPANIEAEAALSEYADVLALVKKNFGAEYEELMVAAARRRNEGVSDQIFGRELAAGVQDIMRGKLKYGAGASMATIDRLAANEASLFHAFGTEGASFCGKMLGMDDGPTTGVPHQSMRRLMQLGTLYRLQAIVEGMPDPKSAAPLSKEELQAFEASVAYVGLNFKDMTSGAFLKAGPEPGKPCLMLEAMHLAIARLADDTRRKVYAGMFFVGRNR